MRPMFFLNGAWLMRLESCCVVVCCGVFPAQNSQVRSKAAAGCEVDVQRHSLLRYLVDDNRA